MADPVDPAAQANLAALAGLDQAQINALGLLVQRMNIGQNRADALPHVKNIPCPIYTIGGDFDTWVVAFMDNIRAVYNLDAADARLPSLYLKWISTKLASGATRAAYENLEQAVKVDWAQLKKALSECFTDEKDKLFFLARMDAHKRLPGQSLRTYMDSLLIKMDKYQGALKGVPEEWRRTALQRFREGLQNPLLKAHLMLNCAEESSTIKDAFKIATSWENTLAQLGKDSDSEGSDSMVSALLGLPTKVDTGRGVTPRMAAMGVSSESDLLARRMGALETKVRQNELHIAEVKDTVSCIKVGMDEVKRDISKGFAGLRQDLASRPRPQYTQSQGQPQYTPAQFRLPADLWQGRGHNLILSSHRPARLLLNHKRL